MSAVLDATIRSAGGGSDPNTLELIGQAVAMGKTESFSHPIDTICSPESDTPVQAKFQALARILDGLPSRGLAANSLSIAASDRIADTIQQARTAAANHTAAENVRVASVQLWDAKRQVEKMISDECNNC